MKKFQSGVIILLFALAIFSCHHGQQVNVVTIQQDTVANAKPIAPKFTAAMVDNKKDLSCGMPVSAGIGDTAHYKGKVYGFCSKECKDAFLKNPDSCLAKNK